MHPSQLSVHSLHYTFQEVDVGVIADVGTLQRLPKIIGNDSIARELAYTARPMQAQEAKQIGLVRYFSSTCIFSLLIYDVRLIILKVSLYIMVE